VAEIQRQSSHQFDPQVVAAFLKTRQGAPGSWGTASR
jgi:HD-GYP domain-containing protein (c-di-GMP phosphodiesterase class II)